ncbi:MAG: carbohydrate kinase, YjeF related protein [Verrucomicrobia bacterium]|nr:carbohydrate kinase, YjeF related protein [Verrucomicrobiota bacterium]
MAAPERIAGTVDAAPGRWTLNPGFNFAHFAAMIPPSHPILSCAQAGRLEGRLFGGDEVREWPAMQRAGQKIAAAVLADFQEIGKFPGNARILVLAGKGHNGGDAMLAAAAILRIFPLARAEILFVFGERVLRPLAARAFRELAQAAGGRANAMAGGQVSGPYDLCLDGVFGFQFRPPADKKISALFERINSLPISLRAAVDLPSADLLRADFTYATGCVKEPLLTSPQAGRVRYLDLDFFHEPASGRDRVLTADCLAPLAGLRAASSDKRSQGHLLVLGGSRNYPGAVLMSVLAALRSGVGLVTAFIPESLAPAYAARAPEAMWVAWPETPDGGLALEGLPLFQSRLKRATAVVIGPGLGRDPETLALVTAIVGSVKLPVLLDADALQPEIIRAAKTRLVLTPHAGEYARIAGPAEKSQGHRALRAYAKRHRATLVLKGPITCICSGAEIHHSFFGGPVLARGGSGDILAGLIGGLLAQTPAEPTLAAARGAVWHGIAADLLARKYGQTAVQTTQLLDFLSDALRESRHEP